MNENDRIALRGKWLDRTATLVLIGGFMLPPVVVGILVARGWPQGALGGIILVGWWVLTGAISFAQGREPLAIQENLSGERSTVSPHPFSSSNLRHAICLDCDGSSLTPSLLLCALMLVASIQVASDGERPKVIALLMKL